MRLSRFGLSVELPEGWEGRIQGLSPQEQAHFAVAGHERPIVHLANFALPPDPGDFGGGAVHLMGEDDAFISLIEHGPESAGSALFSEVGLPRNLRPTSFHPRSLQRTLPGQGGFQHFFMEGGRPFCLYIVIGSFRGSDAVVRQVNRALAAITVGAQR